jgi:hypothetical protein
MGKTTKRYYFSSMRMNVQCDGNKQVHEYFNGDKDTIKNKR